MCNVHSPVCRRRISAIEPKRLHVKKNLHYNKCKSGHVTDSLSKLLLGLKLVMKQGVNGGKYPERKPWERTNTFCTDLKCVFKENVRLKIMPKIAKRSKLSQRWDSASQTLRCYFNLWCILLTIFLALSFTATL